MSIENAHQILFSPSEEQQKIIDALKNKTHYVFNKIQPTNIIIKEINKIIKN